MHTAVIRTNRFQILKQLQSAYYISTIVCRNSLQKVLCQKQIFNSKLSNLEIKKKFSINN